jgi:hypothetical protein
MPQPNASDLKDQLIQAVCSTKKQLEKKDIIIMVYKTYTKLLEDNEKR